MISKFLRVFVCSSPPFSICSFCLIVFVCPIPSVRSVHCLSSLVSLMRRPAHVLANSFIHKHCISPRSLSSGKRPFLRLSFWMHSQFKNGHHMHNRVAMFAALPAKDRRALTATTLTDNIAPEMSPMSMNLACGILT